jgi:hypothetical protein
MVPANNKRRAPNTGIPQFSVPAAWASRIPAKRNIGARNMKTMLGAKAEAITANHLGARINLK